MPAPLAFAAAFDAAAAMPLLLILRHAITMITPLLYYYDAMPMRHCRCHDAEAAADDISFADYFRRHLFRR